MRQTRFSDEKELITNKHPVFCSNMLQRVMLTSKKGKHGMHFKSESQNNLLLVNVVLACNQLCAFVAVKMYSAQDAISASYLSQRSESGRSHTTDHKFVQWMNICSTMSSRWPFALLPSTGLCRVTTCFLESKKEQVKKKHLNRRSKNLL